MRDRADGGPGLRPPPVRSRTSTRSHDHVSCRRPGRRPRAIAGCIGRLDPAMVDHPDAIVHPFADRHDGGRGDRSEQTGPRLGEPRQHDGCGAAASRRLSARCARGEERVQVPGCECASAVAGRPQPVGGGELGVRVAEVCARGGDPRPIARQFRLGAFERHAEVSAFAAERWGELVMRLQVLERGSGRSTDGRRERPSPRKPPPGLGRGRVWPGRAGARRRPGSGRTGPRRPRSARGERIAPPSAPAGRPPPPPTTAPAVRPSADAQRAGPSRRKVRMGALARAPRRCARPRSSRAARAGTTVPGRPIRAASRR